MPRTRHAQGGTGKEKATVRERSRTIAKRAVSLAIFPMRMPATTLVIEAAHRTVQKPTLAGLPSLTPLVVADWRLYRLAKKFSRLLFNITPDEISDVSDEDICDVTDLTSKVVQVIDGYISARGNAGLIRRRLKEQRDKIANALNCIKRGYAPGHMPTDAERLALAERRFKEIA